MRNHLLASAAFILGAALAAPASADITVTGTVDYDKDVTFNETLTKTKNVTILVDVDVKGDTAAESNAVNNQRIGGCGTEGTAPCVGFAKNTHTYTTGPIPLRTPRLVFGIAIDYAAVSERTVVRNVGVTQFNQDVGVGSNQANLISAAVAEQADFVEANNSAAQYNFNNEVTVNGTRSVGTPPVLSVGVIHAAVMFGSVNGNLGVTQVNQNAGVFNNQLNSMSIAFSFNDSLVAMAESDLGQWNANGKATDINVSRVALMVSSVNGNIGVVMGNQAAGYMANQANIVSIAAGF